MGRAGEDVAAIKFRMKAVGGSNKHVRSWRAIASIFGCDNVRMVNSGLMINDKIQA
jgi:hypothetical protein